MKKIIYVRNLPIGNGDITIQSMTNTCTYDIESTKNQILALKNAGADLVRVSVPDDESAKAIKEFTNLGIPIIGDCHFGHKPALLAIENGIDKIRINPTNMTKEGVREVVLLAKQYNVPIRVGVNRGAVKQTNPTAKDLANIAYDTAKIIEDIGYDKLILAVKTSDVSQTIRAYRELNKLCDYPMHIGLTEAGTINMGIMKSAIAIGSLLNDNIGDTIRVSLAGDPVQEIYTAKKILRCAGVDKNFVNVIACPTCARTNIAVNDIATELEKRTSNITFPLKVAVMGCVVNGIGESRDADFGVAGGKEISTIFAKGKQIKQVKNDKILDELMSLVEEYTK